MTTATDTLVQDRCCKCGISYAMPESLRALRLADGQWFYCPNGDAQRYTASAADQLQKITKQRDQWQKEAERLLEECDRLRAGKPEKRGWWERWVGRGK